MTTEATEGTVVRDERSEERTGRYEVTYSARPHDLHLRYGRDEQSEERP